MRRVLGAVAALMMTANLGVTAKAQDSGFFKISEKRRSNTHIDVGAVALSRRAYIGSDTRLTNLFPYAAAEYKGRIFLNPQNGLGVKAINTKKIVWSGSIDYNSGRDGQDTPFESELFDLKFGASLRTAVQYRFKYGAVSTQAALPLAGDYRGLRGSTRVGTLIPITKNLKVSPSVKVSYQSGESLTNLYGLNAEQAQFAGRGTLDYDGGLSGYDLTLAGYWRSSDKKVQALLGASYRDLLGDVKDSPLVDKSGGIFVGGGFARRY